jgi:hypoxanthine phosphoribosyltransferase
MITVKDKDFVLFLTQEEIERRVSELAVQICADYEGRCPLFVIVLNGAFVFAAELVKRIPLSCEVSFIKLASYVNTTSSGKVKEIIGLEEQIEGRDVIIVEDIVDTGLTMKQLVNQIRERKPMSIRITTLLHKPEALQTPISLDYVGFDIENKFVVGYGLDYDGLGRNLNAIYVLA